MANSSHKFIAHRGNINGLNKSDENCPSYINDALRNGYDVEIDVRLIEDNFFLGHDEPQYKITPKFILENKDKLWVHCKNIEALSFFYDKCNCFFHNTDDVVLTSYKYLWTFPGKKLCKNSICVMPDIFGLYAGYMYTGCVGICADNIKEYADAYNNCDSSI